MLAIWIVEDARSWQYSLSSSVVNTHLVHIISELADLSERGPDKNYAGPKVLILDLDYLAQDNVSYAADFSCIIAVSKRFRGILESEREGIITIELERGLAAAELLTILSRIESRVCKKNRSQTGAFLQYQDLELDLATFEVRCHSGKGFATVLSQKEARLLGHFLQNPERLIPREEIRQEVWAGLSVSPGTIDSQISRLRKKIEGAEVTIENSYGNGFIFSNHSI